MRQIVDAQGFIQLKVLPVTYSQLVKLCRRAQDPLPHKKVGKRLMFDVERVLRWFDSQPGRDETFDPSDN